MLGEINRPLVIFNACEVGATGSVLGTVGGWAEAFLHGRFAALSRPSGRWMTLMLPLSWASCSPP